MALAVDDETNLAIAVTVRLLRPGLPVLARIRDPEMDIHHGVLGSDIVINPFERFADALASAVVAPERFRLRQILTGLPGHPLPAPHHPPAGHWVMCGYGRFGHAVTTRLRGAGLTVSVVDFSHYGDGEVDVKGRGTEPGVLEEAGVERASGIVAGHKDDRRNLAIAVRARELNPGIFVVTRQNQAASAPLFEAFPDDLCMEPSRIVAQEFLAVITTPLLAHYLDYLHDVDEPGCGRLIDRLSRLRPGEVPETWSVVVDSRGAPAVLRQVTEGETVTVAHLTADPRGRDESLWLSPLVLAHGEEHIIHPDPDRVLAPGDEVLFVGSAQARRRQVLTLVNDTILTLIRTGEDRATSWIGRRLAARRLTR